MNPRAMGKVYVGESRISGKGIFAARPIKKGEIAFIAKGKLIRFVIRSPQDSRIGPRRIGIGRHRWLDPFRHNPLYFINHSCDSNTGIKGRVMFVAVKDIKQGEEVTFDYSIQDEDTFWKMTCRCGQRDCRGIIRSIQFMPDETIAKYLPYVPTYFKRVYLRHKGMTHRRLIETERLRGDAGVLHRVAPEAPDTCRWSV